MTFNLTYNPPPQSLYRQATVNPLLADTILNAAIAVLTRDNALKSCTTVQLKSYFSTLCPISTGTQLLCANGFKRQSHEFSDTYMKAESDEEYKGVSQTGYEHRRYFVTDYHFSGKRSL